MTIGDTFKRNFELYYSEIKLQMLITSYDYLVKTSSDNGQQSEITI